VAAAFVCGAHLSRAQDPLPSWNDGPTKQAILQFVRSTTTLGSPEFMSPEERIATFDQDGSLWVEHPMYSAVCREARANGDQVPTDARTGLFQP
jgi:hypothetical protein